MSFVPGAKAPAMASAKPFWFLVADAGLVVRNDRTGAALPGSSDLAALGLDPGQALYVGSLNGEDCFALGVDPPPSLEPYAVQNLRSLFATLGDELFVAAGRGAQLVAFERTHRYCGRCGRPTERLPSEHSVRCNTCNLSSYPRVAPAIIVLVRRGEQALLARSGRFPTNMYSTLAGFVEAGESLEQTLAREVREEVGIEVENLRYFASQPWPFPHSLMVGFTADHAGGDIRVDGEEIIDARWFSPHDLPQLPPRPSIARRLIEETWLERT